MTKQLKLFLLILFAGGLQFILVDAVHAQATRTWVSGVGDDANPCSRTAPCKTFAGAISKTAANGEINCIDSGGFGAVTIVKSITIDCGAALGGVLNSGTNGVIINAGVNDKVTLRNLVIHGAGTGLNGVHILNASLVVLSNITIAAQAGAGINFQPATISNLIVEQALVRNNGTHGIYFKPNLGISAKLHASNTSLIGNASAGLRVDDGGVAFISDSVAQANGTNGVLAYASGAASTKIMMERVVSTGNISNGVMANGANASVAMSNVTVAGNGVGVYSLSGGALLSYGNNGSFGNAGASSATSFINSF